MAKSILTLQKALVVTLQPLEPFIVNVHKSKEMARQRAAGINPFGLFSEINPFEFHLSDPIGNLRRQFPLHPHKRFIPLDPFQKKCRAHIQGLSEKRGDNAFVLAGNFPGGYKKGVCEISEGERFSPPVNNFSPLGFENEGRKMLGFCKPLEFTMLEELAL